MRDEVPSVIGDMATEIGRVEDMFKQGLIDDDLINRLIDKLDKIIHWYYQWMDINNPKEMPNTEGQADSDWEIKHNGEILMDSVVSTTSQVLICKHKLLFAKVRAEVCITITIFLSIYKSINLSIYQSINLSFYLSI